MKILRKNQNVGSSLEILELLIFEQNFTFLSD